MLFYVIVVGYSVGVGVGCCVVCCVLLLLMFSVAVVSVVDDDDRVGHVSALKPISISHLMGWDGAVALTFS